MLAGRLISGSTIEMTNGGSGSEASEESPTGSAFWDFIYHLNDWGTIIMTLGGMWACLAAAYYTLLHGSMLSIIVGGTIFFFVGFLLFFVLYTLLHEEIPNIGRLYRRRKIICA